jgi:tetratricopeptide (TPR) repeat protein
LGLARISKHIGIYGAKEAWMNKVRAAYCHRSWQLMVLLVIAGVTSRCLPANARALNHASELFQQQRYEEAVVEYRKAIALDPSWAAPQIGLGNALRATGDRAAALVAYRKAVDLTPHSADAQIALAGLLLETQQWVESQRRLQIALKQLPSDGRLHAMLGYSMAKQGQPHEALNAFRRSLELCDRCMSSDETAIYVALKSRN